ncbi:tRNA uridine-5-carboxymethylaminomethyl(34) synthesis GTPase MnmE [Brucepastera parasyntrophica]|uniref:tRNA uridine-5-carboxymethylaminomethyl(34) synthesis GTPase MnmE n=1 Tax=Brucepastera parasyntrophica TaxID=2880008 RepID=UPI00210BEECA|nr:tRNA uridine-5-carboxymethylaminomethyl(34) synthesis GTPase MnmE [Brucepastera parasyntrophica]ULQ61148.1 tRNA uridine-5-carboxymethylaminomethyl(34) synthesis GTPase MnmE [Brucepastera parasyntrophica]
MKASEFVLHEPIAAIATALVPSALGIVRTSGRGCIELIAPYFSRPEQLLSAAGNTALHGWLYDAPRESTEQRRAVDEVVLTVYRGPKSFTGEDSVEITGHGGTAVIFAIYRLLINAGFRPAEKGEFTFRAFASGKADLSRSEAVREIIEAKTDSARARAAKRLAGSVEKEISEIKDMVLRILAAIEVEIEYPEDEETTGGAFDISLAKEAEKRLERLESSWKAEKLYQEGVRIVLAGSTNAGKSSLFNALLKEDRSIVSDIHGTTRDWIESSVDFAGIPVRLYDTAGLRESEDLIETEGVERSRTLSAAADIVLYLADSTLGLTDADRAFLKQASQDFPPVILIWNKADSPQAGEKPSLAETGDVPRAVYTLSAKTGEGLREMVEGIAEMLLCSINEVSVQEGGPRLGSGRQKNAVCLARISLNHAVKAAEQGYPMDAVSQDMEEALHALGEITGEVTPDDILDTVFSQFCVGK